MKFLAARSAAAGLALVLGLFCAHSGVNAASRTRTCGQRLLHGAHGSQYFILFAKNGAVQAYKLVKSSGNPEQDHDALLRLEKNYGPEGVNAPPLSILSFKKSSGTMMVPDKAVDSCGRTSQFQ
ncbi:MAG: hypothetical protein M3Y21_11005 [Candidatus Eremiobacteraeota bacterium]|nr:hypothetical protein [Candidatus Eremiobacteraeota bacterium]